MDYVTLIRLFSGIAVMALVIILIVKGVKKHRVASRGEKEVVLGLSSKDRIYIYIGCFFCLLAALITHRASEFGFEIGRGFGHAAVAFIIAYIAYGRKGRWHTFSRLFFWLCVIFAMLSLYPI